MSFLSEPLECPFKFHEYSQKSLFIAPRIWSELSIHPDKDKIALSLHSTLKSPPLSCWATQNDQVESVAIPASWSNLYPTFFSAGRTVSITPVEPVPLTEIVLIALSNEAYRLALSSDSIFLNYISSDSQIIRQGSILSFPPNDIPPSQTVAYRFRVDLTEPVLQGYTTPQTVVIVLNEADAFADDSAGSGSESCPDDIEIDEDFLANTIPPFSKDEMGGILHSQANIGSLLLSAHPLPARRQAQDPDDYSAYLRSSELARLGALDGDWVIMKGMNTLKMRLVRVFVLDDIPNMSLAASPILIHNIHQEFLPNSQIRLSPSPFGNNLPPIPVANSVTIARIASPISTNKRYQPRFLAALKTYFDGKKRLVQKGDILAMSMDFAPEYFVPENIDTNSTAWPSGDLVFFQVTNLELDNSSSLPPPIPQDAYSGAVIGELGYWVESNNTKIIQTGLEQSRVPNSRTYFGTPLANLWKQDAITHTNGSIETLLSLISATLLQGAQSMDLNVSILLFGNRGVGKFTAAKWVTRHLGIHLFEINIFTIIGDTTAKTEGALRARFQQAADSAPCLILLRHIDALSETTQSLEPGKDIPMASVLKECIDELSGTWHATGLPMLVVGTTAVIDTVPGDTLSLFKHHIKLEVPNEAERLDILSTILEEELLSQDVSLSDLATQTASLVAADLANLVAQARVLSMQRAVNVSGASEHALFHAGIPLTESDFDIALGQSKAAYSDSIGAPKIPNVSWDDVGGLAHVKSDILDTIQLPLEHPELFAEGLKKRSGILLYGPPGTGKTLLAKAVATSCSLNFFSIKGPELLNMYIGESEANVRRVFQKARDARPCVIFFDELDSIAPKRGNTGDSGGVMDRIVSQLLAELDGMSTDSGSSVFVIGATNRPDLLDPALLRPGRFDRMLYLGVNDAVQDRVNILSALTRKFKLHADLNLEALAEQCPANCTGADFYALCADAMLNAMSRKSEEVEDRVASLNQPGAEHAGQHVYPLTPQYYLSEMATPGEIEVLVTKQDFDLALNNLRPSVSASEMVHYHRIQDLFKSQSLLGDKKDKGKLKARDEPDS